MHPSIHTCIYIYLPLHPYLHTYTQIFDIMYIIDPQRSLIPTWNLCRGLRVRIDRQSDLAALKAARLPVRSVQTGKSTDYMYKSRFRWSTGMQSQHGWFCFSTFCPSQHAVMCPLRLQEFCPFTMQDANMLSRVEKTIKPFMALDWLSKKVPNCAAFSIIFQHAWSFRHFRRPQTMSSSCLALHHQVLQPLAQVNVQIEIPQKRCRID